jgi:hypothetical protein
VPASATEREAAVRAAFVLQAGWCDKAGAPFTALLCRLIGERLDRTTEAGRRVLSWPGDADAFGDALPLRLCGGLHAMARGGSAARLAALYPPAPVPEPETLWSALRPVLDDPALLAWLDGPPQTNEVGRSAVLMGGLLEIAAAFPQPMELLELGASAGLNLLLDRYSYDLGGRATGDPLSPVRLEPQWEGLPPRDADVAVAARRGVDLNPLDPRRDAERLVAYVWPDQQARLVRLQAALAIASAHPPPVDRGDAAEWLEARLAERAQAGKTRVVYHSVAFQYFPAATQAKIAALAAAAGAAATTAAPFAWLRYEADPDDRFTLRLRLWPGHGDRLLAWAHPHGTWIRWAATPAH